MSVLPIVFLLHDRSLPISPKILVPSLHCAVDSWRTVNDSIQMLASCILSSRYIHEKKRKISFSYTQGTAEIISLFNLFITYFNQLYAKELTDGHILYISCFSIVHKFAIQWLSFLLDALRRMQWCTYFLPNALPYKHRQNRKNYTIRWNA